MSFRSEERQVLSYESGSMQATGLPYHPLPTFVLTYRPEPYMPVMKRTVHRRVSVSLRVFERYDCKSQQQIRITASS